MLKYSNSVNKIYCHYVYDKSFAYGRKSNANVMDSRELNNFYIDSVFVLNIYYKYKNI